MIENRFKIIHECKRNGLSLWQCPPFLFLVMGLVNIIAMVGSYLLASRYVDEPEIAAVIVALVSAFILIIGYFIISGFNKIAELNKMKSEFISIVSHQLRSPLSIFKWTVDLLLGDIIKNQSIAQDNNYLKILQENTERMIRTVNILLETNKIEADRFVLNKSMISLEAVTEESVKHFTDYAKSAGITIVYAKPEGLPKIFADQERLKMVIENLIDNALRYSRKGGNIFIAITRGFNRHLRWEIKDEGVGIPEKDQKFIFQKFFRSDNASRYQTSGSGLGLYIARALVKESGGDMQFTSKENEGSTFWFTLPIT
ncbi:HAMP domain-containing histidine kinase [Patescibacteria group bacterium]|nr:HAMP domain-containing histidine kinase [Patescibacteria group bacterium]